MSDHPDETAAVSNAEGRTHREKHLTMKALTNEVQSKTKALQAEWRKTKQTLVELHRDPDDETTLNTSISRARYALESYNKAWLELKNIYAQDKTDSLKEDALETHNAFLENCNSANEAITHAMDHARSLALEVRSDTSRRSGRSRRSGQSSSSILSA